jgi:hypothetical protein
MIWEQHVLGEGQLTEKMFTVCILNGNKNTSFINLF